MKLSIITINYNNYEGLKKTVESVISKVIDDIEYIVVDGGSTDGSAEYLKEVNCNHYSWISEKDNGIYNAMNKGIRMAGGEYLLFLNSGDWLVENISLNDIIKSLNDVDLVIYDLFFIDNENQSRKKHPDKITLSYLLEKTISHPSTFINKRELLGQGGFNESLRIVSDWEFFLKMFYQKIPTYKVLNIPIVYFKLDGISSNNRTLVAKEKELVLRSTFQVFFDGSFCEKWIDRLLFRRKETEKVLRITEKIQKIKKELGAKYFTK
jgi:glycosyltransferase involved in cell wall biosynthesis